jgi:hypothetical protein
MSSGDELLGVLRAYKVARDASWPDLNPSMGGRSTQWARLDVAELEAEVAHFLREASGPGRPERVFWKLGPDLKFAGCNQHFAADAGFARASDLLGLTDFDSRLPWQRQAAKYRADDQEVVRQRQPKLNILERQETPSGMVFVLVSKAPILLKDGSAAGILGIYGVVDNKRASQIYAQQVSKG